MNTLANKPPKIGAFILKFILPYHSGMSALGDYEEIYNRIVENEGKFKAYFWFWAQIFKSIFPFIMNTICWSMIMFSNYLKIAFRNIKKYKGYSFLNIMGLAIGIASTILWYLV